MPIKLDQPQQAYWVMSPEGIVIIEVLHRYTEASSEYFKILGSLWISPSGLVPAAGGRPLLRVEPSARGNPFEHQHVAWTKEEAVDLYRDKQLKIAASFREKANFLLKEAETIKQTDYRKLILNEDTYISPFTGKTI